jgi:hypothetical protein
MTETRYIRDAVELRLKNPLEVMYTLLQLAEAL